MIKTVTLLIVTLGVFGCAPIDIEEFADNSKEAIAEKYIEALVDGNFDILRNDTQPSLKPKLTNEILLQMQNLLSSQEIKEKSLIGYQAHTYGQNPTNYNLSYQYGYGEYWVVWNIAFRTLDSGTNEIIGLNVYAPSDRPLQDIHRFTMENKGIFHYVFLLLCIASPIFILVTLVTALRMKFRRRKWLWIFFIFIGVAKFSLIWTSGQIGYQLLNLSFLGFGIVRASIYTPWILSFSIPLGAIMFWVKREQLRRESAHPNEVEKV